jgi:hypothetical protein
VFNIITTNQKIKPNTIKSILILKQLPTKHKPYLVRYETEDDDRREFIGENCAEDMLHNLPYKKHILLIDHNSNCDLHIFISVLTVAIFFVPIITSNLMNFPKKKD